MNKPPADSNIRLLLFLVSQAYNKPAWHGPNLRNSLRGFTPAQASWRPAPGRHNIWEVAVHTAYWKYVGIRRILGSAVEPFPFKGTDWFPSPEPATAGAWRDALAFLDRLHEDFCAAIRNLPGADLLRPARGSKRTNREIIVGVASHDLYHAGQARLLRRLAREVSASR